jgi:hypothetical protein
MLFPILKPSLPFLYYRRIGLITHYEGIEENEEIILIE